jgi:sugar transferase (PEP-CTERM system associated)
MNDIEPRMDGSSDLLGEDRKSLPLGERLLQLLHKQAVHWLVLLAIGDALLLILAAFAAIYLRYVTAPNPLEAYVSHWLQLGRAGIFAITQMLGMAALGLYQSHMRESWFGVLARQAVGFALGVVILIVLYYLIPEARFGRGILALSLLLGFVVVAGFRMTALRLIDVEAWKRRVLVLGAGSRAALIPQSMRRRADRRGFKIVGFVQQGAETISVPLEDVIVPDISLHAWAHRERIDEIVVGPDERRGGLPMEELLECKQHGIFVTDLATFFERESGKVKLSLAEPSWLIFSQGFDASPLRQWSKRVFDVGAAVVVSLLTWPFMLLVWLAIRLESGKGQPILYRQERVGERGQVFRLIKFRSMRTDAEKDGVARWAGKSDDRVTRVGRIIRRARLDELPQLWNVLRGDMSVIGPRPERPEFVAKLAQKIRYYNLRHCVKPGLAGWAQLRYPYGASEEDASEKLKYDLFYVKNHDLLLDIVILIQTVEIVLFGRGVR